MSDDCPKNSSRRRPSKADLAQLFGVTPEVVRDLLKRRLSPRTLFEIATLLNTTPDQFLAGPASPSPDAQSELLSLVARMNETQRAELLKAAWSLVKSVKGQPPPTID